MPDNNVPQNLPTEGKSMLDNFEKPVVGSEPGRAVPPEVKAPPAPKREVPPPPQRPTPFETKAAEDIFSDVKEAPPPAGGPQKFGGAAVPPAVKKETASVETPRQGFKKIMIVAVSVVVVAGGLGFGGYWAYNNFLKPKPFNPLLNINAAPPAENVVVPAVPETLPQTEQPATQIIIDSDNDGLLDSEEQSLGANLTNPDTDGDGLFDGEEVKVYRTDPLNPDTDGDSFNDGSEVKNGYDPKGPGKLIRIPAGQ